MGMSSKGSPGGSGQLRRHRPGVCHRCGWRGLVSKLTRADRRRLKIGRTFGRICDECADSLLGQNRVGGRALPLKTPGPLHRRNVA